MNKIKLPSMVEYVKLQKEKYIKTNRTNEFACRVLDYSNILPQQPNIRMFVPAVFEDGEWRVLTEPNASQEKYNNYNIVQTIFDDKLYYEDLKNYQTALDNVIFEGFEYDGSEEGFIYVKNGETLLILDTENKTLFLYNSKNNYMTEIKTIEDLIPYSLTLNPKFAKELGLI
jgi:hypothetical protein